MSGQKVVSTVLWMTFIVVDLQVVISIYVSRDILRRWGAICIIVEHFFTVMNTELIVT